MATVKLGALASGTSPITLSEIVLLDSSLTAITSKTVNGAVNIVPEPATLLLLTAGMAGILGVGWRARKNKVQWLKEYAFKNYKTDSVR